MDGLTPSGCRILVVEDNPGDARLVEIYLKEDVSDGFQVRKAERLADALAALAAEPADVVLLDLSLPDSHGLVTLERLRQAHPFVPVVVLTGNTDSALALQALRQGAQDYLVKGQGDGELVRRAVRYAMERSRIDVALRQSEARFRTIFESAGLGVMMVDPDGVIQAANPAYCLMLGRSESDVRHSTIASLTHPDDWAQQSRLFQQMRDGSINRYSLTKRYLNQQGGVVWGHMTASALRDNDDPASPLRYVVAVVEDITERKQMEDRLRLAATVFENSGDGLFVTDADRRIIHVNPAFTEITGYLAQEVLGHTPSILSSGRHGPDFYQHMHQMLQENGKWQGEIWDRRKSGEMFAGWQNIAMVRDDEGTITHYVSVISDITSRKQMEERLSYQANHDPLTRLPNRTLFHERLSRAVARAHRNHTLVALMFIDLDHFKEVNDTQGHLAGDMLLQQVAERMTGCTRQGDTVARLAGDEFTVILEDVTDTRDAAVVAHKILRAMSDPFDLNGSEAHISSSIGVALYPADGGDPQTLLRLADGAMYRAKHMGRNTCQFHSEAINAQAFERLALENALSHALGRQEFFLNYQPIFCQHTGQVTAVEALLRWQHPEVGTVVPSQFLPLAEETGLIVPIGQWVMAEACRQIQEWRTMCGLPDLAVHINLSGRQLRAVELSEQIALALEYSRLPAEAVVLEIPETSVVDRNNDPAPLLSRLAAMGVGLAIDDFGSGFSSFAILRRLPVKALKISQSYVRSIANSSDDMEMVSAIFSVAKGLHLSVTALGIEHADQLTALKGLGNCQIQGFLLARPMSAVAIADWLKQQHTLPTGDQPCH